MQEFESISASSYDPSALATKLTQRSAEGWEVIGSNLELERIQCASGYVGNAQQAVDDALLYATQRHQFGQPIYEFQVLKHMLADMQTEVDAARLLVVGDARVLDDAPWLRSGPAARVLVLLNGDGEEARVVGGAVRNALPSRRGRPGRSPHVQAADPGGCSMAFHINHPMHASTTSTPASDTPSSRSFRS